MIVRFYLRSHLCVHQVGQKCLDVICPKERTVRRGSLNPLWPVSSTDRMCDFESHDTSATLVRATMDETRVLHGYEDHSIAEAEFCDFCRKVKQEFEEHFPSSTAER